MARIDASARRILSLKFRLGLFDNPFVGELERIKELASRKFRRSGRAAQQRSITLLTNKTLSDGPILPLNGRPKVYAKGLKPDLLAEYAEVVRSPTQADFAVLSLKTARDFKFHKEILPYFFSHGRLDYPKKRLRNILKICETVPTIVAIHMDRPAVVPEIAEKAAALVATFGVENEVLVDAIFGKFDISGKLPLDLPRSMASVIAHDEDVRGFDDALFPAWSSETT